MTQVFQKLPFSAANGQRLSNYLSYWCFTLRYYVSLIEFSKISYYTKCFYKTELSCANLFNFKINLLYDLGCHENIVAFRNIIKFCPEIEMRKLRKKISKSPISSLQISCSLRISQSDASTQQQSH